jgi:hypothetical protein
VNNNQPLKENSLLWEVTCLHDHNNKRHDVILTISHAIFDGISSVEFSRDLLVEIAAVKKGNATAIGMRPPMLNTSVIFDKLIKSGRTAKHAPQERV